jgi:hypothetical protein
MKMRRIAFTLCKGKGQFVPELRQEWRKTGQGRRASFTLLQKLARHHVRVMKGGERDGTATGCLGIDLGIGRFRHGLDRDFRPTDGRVAGIGPGSLKYLGFRSVEWSVLLRRSCKVAQHSLLACAARTEILDSPEGG